MNIKFYYLCNSLYVMTTLTIHTPTDKFLLQTDTSARGIAGILSVVREEEELPIRFSHGNGIQRKPGTEDQVGVLALLKPIQHFGMYIIGQEFSVATELKAHSSLLNAKHLNGWLVWWAFL